MTGDFSGGTPELAPAFLGFFVLLLWTQPHANPILKVNLPPLPPSCGMVLSTADGLLAQAAPPPTGVKAAMKGSRNVALIIIYQLLDGIAFSLWNATVQQQLIYTLSDPGSANKNVGYWAGISGVVQMLVAFVGGYLADKAIKRELVCRVGVVNAAIAISLTAAGTSLRSLPLFYAAAVFWGGYGGLSNSAVEALFADSVASGNRASIYTLKWIIQILSYLGGYVASIILFTRFGNDWSLTSMTYVMYSGLGVHIFAILSLLLPSDEFAIPKLTVASAVTTKVSTKSFAHRAVAENFTFAAHESDTDSDDDAGDKVPSGFHSTASTDKAAPAVLHGTTINKSFSDANSVNRSFVSSRKYRDLKHSFRPVAEALSAGVTNTTFSGARSSTKHGWAVPWLIATGDLTSALGAGMTVRYLQLFFVNDYGTSPVAWAIISTITCVTTAVCAQLVKWFAGVLKTRVVVLAIVRLTAAALMMVLAEAQGSAAGFYPMATCYIARMALSNSMLGMSRSVIMDFVPKEHRARWSAAESIGSFSWSGSALIGGVIADHDGYRATFVITAVLQGAASIVLVPAAVIERTVRNHLIALGLVTGD